MQVELYKRTFKLTHTRLCRLVFVAPMAGLVTPMHKLHDVHTGQGAQKRHSHILHFPTACPTLTPGQNLGVKTPSRLGYSDTHTHDG